MKLLLLIVSWVLMLGACATSYKTIPFYDFSGKAFQKDILPVTVEIPKNYEIFKPQGGLASSTWLSPKDVDMRSAPFPSEPTDSFFAVQLSRSLNYDSQLDLFQFSMAGNIENDLAKLKLGFEQKGMKEVSIKRHNVAGFPLLQMELLAANNTKIRRFYIGTKIATNTIEISFIGKNSDGKDDEIWDSFVASIMNGY